MFPIQNADVVRDPAIAREANRQQFVTKKIITTMTSIPLTFMECNSLLTIHVTGLRKT